MKQNNRQENRQLFSNFINLLVLPVPELSRSHTLSCWCCQVLPTLQAPRPQTNRCFLCSAVECSVFTCVFIVFHVFHNALPGNLVWRSELPWLLETCVAPKVTCTCSRWPPYIICFLPWAEHTYISYTSIHIMRSELTSVSASRAEQHPPPSRKKRADSVIKSCSGHAHQQNARPIERSWPKDTILMVFLKGIPWCPISTCLYKL